MTPWDDDFDLLANGSRANDILVGFQNMVNQQQLCLLMHTSIRVHTRCMFFQSNFSVVRHSSYLLKVFSPAFALRTYPKYEWSWPWIDVFLYEDRGHYIVSGNENKAYRSGQRTSDDVGLHQLSFLDVPTCFPSAV